MGVVLPVLVNLALFLGSTYDLRKNDWESTRIFGNSQKFDEVPISDPKVSATYIVLPEDVFPYEYFGIPVDLAVIDKHNNGRRSGDTAAAAIMKAGIWRQDSVTVVVNFVYRTMDKTAKGCRPLPGILDRAIRENPTHYVETLNYASHATALIRYKCESEEDRKQLRDIFTSRLGQKGNITAEVAENFQKAVRELEANEELNRRVTYSIQNFANNFEMLKYVTRSQDWMKIVQELPKSPASVASVELQPLKNLDSRFSDVQKYEEQADALKKLDMMLDDVKVARDAYSAIDDYLIKHPGTEEKMYKLWDLLGIVRLSLLRVVRNASLYKQMDQNLIKLVFEEYYNGLEGIGYDTYYKAVQGLKVN